MARIRSIHPGLFTDEAFASLSMAARVLLLGVWTESDDHGVFEWKPVTLKMRVMPVDNVDIPTLLAECESVGVIKRFTSGKSYGLVRNFCRYQRPKKPNYLHPMPPELRTYAGLNEDGSLPVLHQSGTGPEKPPQREEGGGRRDDGNGGGVGSKPAPAKTFNGSLKGKLTLDFQPSADARATIAGMGFGEKQFNAEFSKFVAYYMARGTERDDWHAALVSWFQRAIPDAAPSAQATVLNKVFVILGTPGWRSWVDTIKRTKGITWTRTIERRDEETGRIQEGWWWASEFAPGYDEATGERIQSSEDAA